MKFVSLFACLFLLACSANSESPAARQKAIPVIKHQSENQSVVSDALVTIESTYKDLAHPEKEVPVKGTGFLIQSGTKTFVATASHVSQGDKLVIHHQGQTLTVKGRLFVEDNDVEVIEVENVSHPVPFVLDEKGIEWQGQEIGRTRWVDALSFVLLNDWVFDPNLAADSAWAKQELSHIQCDILCNLLQSTTLMQPGSSGSPLIVKIPNATEWTDTSWPFDVREGLPQKQFDKYFLRGLTIRRDRFFARSSFIPVSKILKALKSYNDGNRTAASPKVKWNVSGNLIFRVSDGYLFESAAASGSSGNGVSMDGGDVGDLQEENPSGVLSNISAAPVENGEPRMYWMMMMRHPNGAMISAPLWFDMEHYLPIKRFTMGLSPDPSQKDNLLNFFVARWGRKGMPAVVVSGDGISKISHTPGMVQIETPTADGARLNFFLNTKGAYCKDANTCADKFMAIIEVPASNGRIYFVDLRGFLFVNPAQSKSAAFHDPNIAKLSDTEWRDFFFDRFIDELQEIRLTFRPKRAVTTPLTVEAGQVTERVWTIQ